MKNLWFKLTIAIAALWLCSSSWAGVPGTISFQGKLTDGVSGVSGSYFMRFALYDLKAGGEPLWSEEQGVEVENGNLFGSTSELRLPLVSVDDKPFEVDTLFLEVQICPPESAKGCLLEEMETLSPRQMITSVLFAKNADKLDGYDSTDFIVNRTGSVTSSHLGTDVVQFEHLAADSVHGRNIADSAITADMILNNAVTTLKLADESISSFKLKDGRCHLVKNCTRFFSGPWTQICSTVLMGMNFY